jgi:hypothetical protein
MLEFMAVMVTFMQIALLALKVAILYAGIRALNSLSRWLDNSESEE